MITQSNNQRRKVYLEPPWLMKGGQWSLYKSPPEGYGILLRKTPQEEIFCTITSSSIIRTLLRSVDLLLPTRLIKSTLERNKKTPHRAALTYSIGHLVLRQEPWVLEMEFAFLLAGWNTKYLNRFKYFVRQLLESFGNMKILTTSEAAKKNRCWWT